MARQGVEPLEVSNEDVNRAFETAGGKGANEVVTRRQSGMVAAMGDAMALPALAPARDEARVLQKITALAAAAGEDWYYRFPVNRNVKDENGRWTKIKDWIEGPSVKCANNVARIFGNCIVDCRLGDETDDAWVFYARFVDRETGFVLVRAFQQRKAQAALNSKDPGRALDLVFQIGQSKSIRNVVCNALETFTNRGFEEAKKSLVARIGSKMGDARNWIIDQLAVLKVALERVEYAHARKSREWLAPDMALIYAEINSVHDGMAHPDELWPVREPEVDAGDRKTVSERNREIEEAGRKRDEEARAAEQSAKAAAEAKRVADQDAARIRAEEAQMEEDARRAAEEAKRAQDEKDALDARERAEAEERRAAAADQQGSTAAERAATKRRSKKNAADQQQEAPPPDNAPAPVDRLETTDERSGPAADEIAKDAGAQPRVIPYQTPPGFWAEAFIKEIKRMGSERDVDDLMDLNAKYRMFIQRVAPAFYDKIEQAAADQRRDLAG